MRIYTAVVVVVVVSRSGAVRVSSSLVYHCAKNTHEVVAVNAGGGVEAAAFLVTGIDDVGDSGEGERGSGNLLVTTMRKVEEGVESKTHCCWLTKRREWREGLIFL